jgi:hypothetical protein
MSWPVLRSHLSELSALAAHDTELSIREKVKEIIPDYQYAAEGHPPSEPQLQPQSDIESSISAAGLSVGATAGS